MPPFEFLYILPKMLNQKNQAIKFNLKIVSFVFDFLWAYNTTINIFPPLSFPIKYYSRYGKETVVQVTDLSFIEGVCVCVLKDFILIFRNAKKGLDCEYVWCHLFCLSSCSTYFPCLRKFVYNRSS